MSGTLGPMLGQATGVRGNFFQKPLGALTTLTKKFEQMRTPGWQLLTKSIIFIVLIVVFGAIYQVVIGNNKEEWAHPTDGSGSSIINGMYVSTVVNSTVGFGDYYPYSQRGMVLVVFNVMISWILFSMFLG